MSDLLPHVLIVAGYLMFATVAIAAGVAFAEEFGHWRRKRRAEREAFDGDLEVLRSGHMGLVYMDEDDTPTPEGHDCWDHCNGDAEVAPLFDATVRAEQTRQVQRGDS